MTNKQFARQERVYTIELLEGLKPEQWRAQTLCGDWKVEDLAAHLVSRERNVIGDIGLVVAGLQRLHDKSVARVAARGHEYILERLKRYPWYMPGAVNTAEFWVHNEDLLRGELALSRPEPSPRANAILWGSLKGLTKLKKGLVADLGNLTLKNSETNEQLTIKTKDSNKSATVSGNAGELLLFFYGRRKAAKVTLTKQKP